MNQSERKIVEGFLVYLQGIYGNQDEEVQASFGAPNALLMPEFAQPDPEPDYEAVAGALGGGMPGFDDPRLPPMAAVSGQLGYGAARRVPEMADPYAGLMR